MELKPYIMVIWRKRALVIVTTLLAGLVALAGLFVPSPRYEATVLLVSARQRTEVELGSQIDTLTQEEMGGTLFGNSTTTMAGLASLALNPDIAREVVGEFGSRLGLQDEEGLELALFIANHVEAKVLPSTGVLAITITWSEPQLAADIANAWGASFERHINSLYASVGEPDVEIIRAQREEAYQAYGEAQLALEEFLVSSTIRQLEYDATALDRQVESYQEAREEGHAILAGAELEARASLLADYHQQLVSLQGMLDDAKALRGQVLGRGESWASALGDSLALLLLRSGGLPAEEGSEAAAGYTIELQVPVGIPLEDLTTEDVDTVIQVLESRITKTEEQIEGLTGSLFELPEEPQPSEAELQAAIEALTETSNSLRAQLEAERAREQSLIQQRDLAWETYTSLARRETEMVLAARSRGTEVRLGSRAAPPVRSVQSGEWQNVVASVLLGLVVGVGLAFLTESRSEGLDGPQAEEDER